MDALLFSLNVVVPLLICAAAGHLSRQKGIICESFIDDCGSLLFNIVIPCSIFSGIASSDISQSLNPELVIFLAASGFAVVCGAKTVCGHLIKDRRTAATVAHCIFRGNFTMLGVPIAVNLLGTQGAVPMLVSVPFGILCSNIGSALILPGESGGGERPGVLTTTASVLRNPMTIASLLGILVSWLRIPLPQAVHGAVNTFAKMSGGLALFMLGVQFDLSSMRSAFKYTAVIALVRMVINPLIFVLIAVHAGFRGGTLAAVYLYYATPTAVSSFVLAKRMGGDPVLSGEAVIATTAVSALTITIGIYILKTLCLI